jgi:hypothetical protein
MQQTARLLLDLTLTSHYTELLDVLIMKLSSIPGRLGMYLRKVIHALTVEGMQSANE